MTELKPYRVVITTGTPIVMTQFAPTFDALVYEALEQFTNLKPEDIVNKMKELILWNSDLGVFHASAMRFVVGDDYAVVRKNYVRVSSQKDIFLSKNFSPNGRNGTYKGVITGGGAFKKKITERLAYSSKAVCFDVVCNETLVKRLLQNSFVGIGYDAFSAGMGEIRSIEFIEVEEDLSISFNGKARRNIPADKMQLNGETELTPVVPPYYTKHNKVAAYTPERISTISVNNITMAI